MNSRQNALMQIIMALVLPGCAALISVVLWEETRFVTFLPFVGAIVIVAYFGNLLGTMLAFGMTYLLIEGFVVPAIHMQRSAEWTIWYLVFFGVVFIISWTQELLRRSAGKLQATSQQLNGILDAVSDSITVTDATGRFVYANAAAERMTGVLASDFQRTSLQSVSEDYEMEDENGQRLTLADLPSSRALATGQRCELTFRSRSARRGTDRWVQMASVPVRVNGQIQHVVNVFRDISVNKTADQQQRVLQERVAEQARVIDAQRRRLEDLLNTVPAMVWEGEGDPASGQTMVYVNRYGEEMLGYSQEEWRQAPGAGRAWIHPDDLAHTDQKTAENFRLDQPQPFEFRLIAKDGRIVTVEARASIVRDENGQPIAARGVMTDVTARRRIEDELRRSNEELQQFAYVASHDLQEPLRMVTSYLQLLDERYRDKLDDDAREFIGFAVDGAVRMKALIDDLLVHSRVQTNQERFQPVNLNDVLARVLRNLDSKIAATGAQVTYDVLPTVSGNPNMLTQLLQNLISNALKFHSDAPPVVQIGVEPGHGEWIFRVRDNGIGIDPRHAERIFVIFQRLHGRSTYPGTGIGLAICRKVVERHGGRIWVESQKGEGATFCFTLPSSPN